ncbi:transcriptional regulator [Streptomyces sp. NBC_00829]|uniref:helix-turn-helix transcriptional regulator n=1 Tax=Streptomyces sp. NBC_00829 TaxID=2903679 RepID=UPI0038702516|nr:PAS domain-containing protein [Streptomyces sp. NBC_00829]
MKAVEEGMDPRVRMWAPVGQAVALLLGPYAEVVLHDLDTDRVLAVWNPMSARAPGDPSLLGELSALDTSARDVFGPYEKQLADGRRLSSVSAVLREADGRATAVLCVNLDRTPLEQAAAVLTAFGAPAVARPEPLFEQDWNEQIQHIVGAYVRECGRPVERLTRADRLAVLARLEDAGVFAVRRAAPVVARALQISRSTIYGLLAERRTSRDATPSSKDHAP